MTPARTLNSIGPNPIHPDHLTPAERRAEMCGLLALGLARLRMRDEAAQSSDLSDGTGESLLDHPLNRSGHATPTQEETA